MEKIDSISVLNTSFKYLEATKYSTNSYFFEDELKKLINSNSLFFEISNHNNLIIYKYVEELNFYEVYYYITDTAVTFNIIDKEDFVMEIPYRGSKNYPYVIVEFWNNSGFATHINRDLMGLINPDTDGFILLNSDLEYTFVDNLNLVNLIIESIKTTFDKYTGDILTEHEVISAIKNKEIIGAFKEGELAGFLRFYAKNKVSWIGHLVVLPEYSGKGIGKNLVGFYLKIRSEQGFTNFQQWVVSNNDAALKLYTSFGFKYSNKSSISLLKTNKNGRVLHNTRGH